MRTAIRAKYLIPLSGESAALGSVALDAPAAVLRDGVLVARDGIIEAVEPYASFTRRRDVHTYALCDMGDVTLAPAFINGHCHLELSHLAQKTTAGKGFVPWLQSLIPLAAAPLPPEDLTRHIAGAVRAALLDGTALTGDVGSRNPASVADAAEASADTHGFPLAVMHFLELFGFAPPALQEETPFPPGYAAEGYCPAAARQLSPHRLEHCAIAGHALYSTSPRAMRAAHAWCHDKQRTFSMHLAEHSEETECLLRGRGPLYELLAERILPPDWQAPALRPVAFAESLGLLGPHTLAVHCVQCDGEDVARLARARAMVCLCPRSNAFINVGVAPAKAMIRAGLHLCLGTDSLASNTDLRMHDEIQAARSTWGLSPQAALRLATVNGAAALGAAARMGTLEPGKVCRFSLWEHWDA